jgi:hypothetical protein
MLSCKVHEHPKDRLKLNTYFVEGPAILSNIETEGRAYVMIRKSTVLKVKKNYFLQKSLKANHAQ